MTNKEALELALITLDRDNLKVGNTYVNYDIKKALIKLIKKKLEKKKQKDIPNNLPIANLKEDELVYPPQREPVLPGGGGGSGVPTINGVPLYSGLPQSEPEALIRADELETIGAESSLARAMAARTIRLLYKENETLRAALAQPEPTYKPMHPELRKMYEDYFDAAFKKLVPQQREWVGLTEQEQSDIAWQKDMSRLWIVTATEAKLKEKNCG